MTPLQHWIDFCVRECGCILCRRDGIHSYGDYHHMLKNGKRMGPMFGFGLCPSHHRWGGNGVVAREQNVRRFQKAYGPEWAMYEETKALYDEFKRTGIIKPPQRRA